MKHKFCRVLTAVIAAFFTDEWQKRAIRLACRKQVFYHFWHKKITLKTLELSLEKGNCLPILAEYDRALALKEHCDAGFVYTKNELFVSIKGLRFRINRPVEIYIFHEVFFRNEYAFSLKETNESEGVVVLDVGMNVGIASLFFANMNCVSKIYAYEPMPQLYAEALLNFSLNAHCAHKIMPSNVGIDRCDGELAFHFDAYNTGRTSAFLTPALEGHTQTIYRKVRDIGAVLADIKNIHTSAKIVLKIDCEGMEFNIVEALTSSDDLLDRVTLIMLEWHGRDPQPIIDGLVSKGFCVIRLREEPQLGFVYAFKAASCS